MIYTNTLSKSFPLRYRKFVSVPSWLIEESGLPDSAHLVLLHLLRKTRWHRHNPKTWCQVLRGEISKKTGLSSSQVSQAQKLLIQRKLITTKKINSQYEGSFLRIDLSTVFRKDPKREVVLYRNVPLALLVASKVKQIPVPALRFWMIVYHRWVQKKTGKPRLAARQIAKALNCQDPSTVHRNYKKTQKMIGKTRGITGVAPKYDPLRVIDFLDFLDKQKKERKKAKLLQKMMLRADFLSANLGLQKEPEKDTHLTAEEVLRPKTEPC